MNTTHSNFSPATSFVFDPSLTPTDSSTVTNLTETDGKVVALFERTSDWSYFDDFRTFRELWAVVWNSAEGRATMKHVTSTEDYGSVKTAFRPNAPVEDVAAFWDWYKTSFTVQMVEKRAASTVECARLKVQKNLDELMNPSPKDFRRGDEVMVARGRKFPKGLKGKVFWSGENTRFGGWTLGVATSDRRDEKGRNADVAWISAQNVELIPSGERLTRKAEVDARLVEIASPAFKAQALHEAAEFFLNFPANLLHELAAVR